MPPKNLMPVPCILSCFFVVICHLLFSIYALSCNISSMALFYHNVSQCLGDPFIHRHIWSTIVHNLFHGTAFFSSTPSLILAISHHLSKLRLMLSSFIICKLMEGFITNYILNQFIDNNFFSNKQFGCLKGWPTMLQLLFRKWRTDKCYIFRFQEGFW